MSNEKLTVNTDKWPREGHNDPLIIRTTETERSIQIESNTTVTYPSNKQLLHPKEYCLKYHIYEKVRKLKINNDKVLLASYGGAQEPNEKYDLENKLFYNIGSGAFSGIFRDFPKEAAFQMASKPDNGKYLYKYEIITEQEVKNKLDKKTLLVKWENISIGGALPQNADAYYISLRSANVRVANDSNDAPGENEVMRYSSEPYEKSFGIKIELTVPESNKTSHPVSVIKHLLDGVICAFHGEKAGLAEIFSEKIKNAGEDWNILGPCEYLRKHGNVVQWNPEDNRLQFGWIIVNKGTEYKMSGKIYKWD